MRSSAAVDHTLFSNSQFIALTLKRYYVYVIVLADCSALDQSARFGRARLDSARLGWFWTRSCRVSSHLTPPARALVSFCFARFTTSTLRRLGSLARIAAIC